MVIAKQMDIRSNIKKYFDIAYDGETIIVPRKENKNVVIISEDAYNQMRQVERVSQYGERLSAVSKVNSVPVGNIKEDNLNRLQQIKELKKGWNGNGAPAIPQKVIDQAYEILSALPIQPEIFPTALKSVQLEYDNSRRDHMEIEINGSAMAEVFIVTYFGSENINQINATAESITERVQEFYE